MLLTCDVLQASSGSAFVRSVMIESPVKCEEVWSNFLHRIKVICDVLWAKGVLIVTRQMLVRITTMKGL